MGKHTPGPWEASLNVCETRWLIYTQEQSLRHRGYLASTAETNEDSEANAKLMAAAPDLLDALKELVTVAESHISCPCPEIDEARAAIAKAEGK